ncbi:MAG: hypothetical protein ACFFC3_03475 [Candidatus Odinarchaeota archaeon]
MNNPPIKDATIAILSPLKARDDGIIHNAELNSGKDICSPKPSVINANIIAILII